MEVLRRHAHGAAHHSIARDVVHTLHRIVSKLSSLCCRPLFCFSERILNSLVSIQAQLELSVEKLIIGVILFA